MVIRCPHCKSMMRIDETLIPRGGGVRIRCPRCKGMDYVRDQAASPSQATPPDQSRPEQVRGEQAAMTRPAVRPSHDPVRSSGVTEATMPDDAFQGFRFPAERETGALQARTLSRSMKILLWVIASLVVVAVFALLVNIVLPGPGGSRPFGGTISSEQNQPGVSRLPQGSVRGTDFHRSPVAR